MQNDLVETVAPDARVGTGPPGHWGETGAAALQADVAGDRSAERSRRRTCFRKPRPDASRKERATTTRRPIRGKTSAITSAASAAA